MSKCTTSDARRNTWKSRKARVCLSIEVSSSELTIHHLKEIDSLTISTSHFDLCTVDQVYTQNLKYGTGGKPHGSPLTGTGTKRLPHCTSINPLVAGFGDAWRGAQVCKGSGRKGVWISACLPTIYKCFNILVVSIANSSTDWLNTSKDYMSLTKWVSVEAGRNRMTKQKKQQDYLVT